MAIRKRLRAVAHWLDMMLARLGRRVPPAWRLRLKSWSRSVLLAVLVVGSTEILVTVADIFGIEAAVKQRAAVVIQRVIGPNYSPTALAWVPSSLRLSSLVWPGPCTAPGSNGRDTAGQCAVTVLLFDARALRDLPGDRGVPVWPPPVSTLANTIDAIDSGKPAAIFVDLALPRAPREIEAGDTTSLKLSSTMLVRRLGLLDIDDSAAPIFIADNVTLDDVQQRDANDCERDFLPDEKVGAGGTMPHEIRSGVFDDPNREAAKRSAGRVRLVDSVVLAPDGSYRLAPLQVGPKGNCNAVKEGDRRYLVSPALALFKAYSQHQCAQRHGGGPPTLCRRAAFQRLDKSIEDMPRDTSGFSFMKLEEPAIETMALRWGTQTSGPWTEIFQSAQDGDKCKRQFGTVWWLPLKMYLTSFLGRIEHHYPEQFRSNCIYVDTISVADLEKQYLGADRKMHNLKDRFIRDRVVLLGVDVPQAQDRYESPINGDIPGVYVHAVAVENLITSGSGYARAETTGLGWAGLVLFEIVLVALMEMLWRWLCNRWSGIIPPLGEFVMAPAVFFVIVSLSSLMLVTVLSLAPLSLVDIALPVVALHVVLFAGWVARLKERLEHRLGIAHHRV